MGISKQTSPKLAVSIPMSKANATAARLDALVPNLASDLSPSLVYLPGADDEVVKNGAILTSSDFGWTAPDLNNGQPYNVQVECFGAGGGGGGGNATGVGGGGGGGGAEYACEPLYPVIPGETYSYFAGFGGKGGRTSALVNGIPAFPGFSGQPTQFDLRGKGMTGGVFANGGTGGDQAAPGLGGPGGTGSTNTVHFDGGAGATSSSGIMSDNPINGLTGGLTNTIAWFRLDEAVGKTVAQDFSHARVASGRVQGTGNIVAPVASPVGPPQTPFGAANNWWGGTSVGETKGNVWQWNHGTGSGLIGGLTTNIHTPALSAITISAWIKGSATATHVGDWTDGTHTACTIATSMDISVPGVSKGWEVLIGDGGTTANLTFAGVNSAGSEYSFGTTSGPAANDGNWHQIVVAFGTGTNNVNIFVDGVAVATGTSGIAQIAASSKTIAIGYNQTTNSYGFKGYMSNVWIATGVTASSAFVAAAFGSTPATGGSGGGASGGSAGTGNAGTTASAGTGGPGGASAAPSDPGINSGSGAGGAGGNSNNNGSVAPALAPYAGGGGGAGADTAAIPSAFSLEVPCSMSASYAGLDASGAAAGQLYTVSADPASNETDPWYNTAAKQDAICYSGGAAGAPFKGSMNTLLTFPSLASIDANSGTATDYLASGDWTIQKAYLKLTIETVNPSILVIGTWNSNAIIGTLDSDTTLTTWGYSDALLTAYIPGGVAGRQVLIDLDSTSIMTTFINNAYSNGFSQSGSKLQGTGLLIGTLQGSATYAGNVHGAWNADEAQDWYTAFHGADTTPGVSAALEIYYTASGASVLSAGSGADGYIVIRFIDPKGTPVATVLPQAATDDSNNALGAGFTADAPNYNVWQPGSSPRTLEVPQTFVPANGWVTANGVNCCYQLLPGNMLYINFSVNSNAKTNAVIATLPSGWRPASTHIFPLAPNSASAPVGWGTLETNGHLSVANGSGNFTYSCSVVIKLDV